MSKTIFGILVIIAISALVGTSIIQADASKPQIISGNVSLSVPVNAICSVETAQAEIKSEWTTMIWDDNKFKYSETRASEIFDEITGELIATSYSKFMRHGEFDNTGVFVMQFNEIINCMNGDGPETSHFGATINKNGHVSHGK
jgi:hypothetical protein